MSLKRDVLTGLQELDAACAVDGEIIAEFGEVLEPELRQRVAFALAHRAHTLLRADRVGEALQDSDELLRRFRGEDDPVVVERTSRLLLSQARSLIRVGSPPAASVTANVGVALVGALGEGTRLAGQRLRLGPALGAGRLLGLGGSAAMTPLSRLRVPQVVADQRRRAAQTLVISREIVDRFALDEERDREQTVAAARIHEAVALILLAVSATDFAALTSSKQRKGGRRGCIPQRSRRTGVRSRLLRRLRRGREPGPPRVDTRARRSPDRPNRL